MLQGFYDSFTSRNVCMCVRFLVVQCVILQASTRYLPLPRNGKREQRQRDKANDSDFTSPQADFQVFVMLS